jgi:hypothetical protein
MSPTSPSPFHGRLSTAGRLRRREAVLRETPPAPFAGGETFGSLRSIVTGSAVVSGSGVMHSALSGLYFALERPPSMGGTGGVET